MLRVKPNELPAQTNFLEQLAHTLGVEVNATHIFAPPVERHGLTVIPVAKARYGFGGGSGQRRGEGGGGGGGGAVITPVGYIEISPDGARYRPIRDPLGVLAAVAVGSVVAGGVAGWLVVSRLFKAPTQNGGKQ